MVMGVNIRREVNGYENVNQRIKPTVSQIDMYGAGLDPIGRNTDDVAFKAKGIK